LGIYFVGRLVSIGVGLPRLDVRFRGRGFAVSLFGFLVFRVEPFFLGLGCQLGQSVFSGPLCFFHRMNSF
jgi:hypothetical protein